MYIQQPILIVPLSPTAGMREIAVNPDTQAIITAAQPIYGKAATYHYGT